MKYIITYNNENNYDQLGGAGAAAPGARAAVGTLDNLTNTLIMKIDDHDTKAKRKGEKAEALGKVDDARDAIIDIYKNPTFKNSDPDNINLLIKHFNTPPSKNEEKKEKYEMFVKYLEEELAALGVAGAHLGVPGAVKMAAGPVPAAMGPPVQAVVPAGVKMAAVPGAAALGAAVPDVGVKMAAVPGAAGPDVGVKMAAGPAKRKAKRKGLKLKPVGNKGFGFINNEKNVDPVATKALADAAAAKVLADAAAAKALADAAAAKALADAAAAKALADAAAAAQYQIEYNKPDKGKNVNSILQQQQQQQQQQMQQQQQQQQMEQQRKQLQQQLDQQNSVSSFDTDSCCSSTSSEM